MCSPFLNLLRLSENLLLILFLADSDMFDLSRFKREFLFVISSRSTIWSKLRFVWCCWVYLLFLTNSFWFTIFVLDILIPPTSTDCCTDGISISFSPHPRVKLFFFLLLLKLFYILARIYGFLYWFCICCNLSWWWLNRRALAYAWLISLSPYLVPLIFYSRLF